MLSNSGLRRLQVCSIHSLLSIVLSRGYYNIETKPTFLIFTMTAPLLIIKCVLAVFEMVARQHEN